MTKRIFVAGHKGMVGSSLFRKLSQIPDVSLISASRSELNLEDFTKVHAFLKINKPDQVYIAAARVGGIQANNSYPAEFILENLLIQSNLIQASYLVGVQKLVFLGSSCIYPQLAEQPIREDSLLTGKLEPTNEPYAIAKIAGIKMCESYNRQYGVDYRCVMPTNLYGENDNFHLENSHVIPAMIRRFHEAKISKNKTVVLWGTGKPRREFLHVDDMASACIYIMNLEYSDFSAIISNQMCSHINVGTGKDIAIAELADIIAEVVGYKGDILFDSSKPDGAPQKLLDVTRLDSLGWKHSIDLEMGLENTYKWFLNNLTHLRK